MKIYIFNFWNCKMNIIIILKKKFRIILFEGNICIKENKNYWYIDWEI